MDNWDRLSRYQIHQIPSPGMLIYQSIWRKLLPSWFSVTIAYHTLWPMEHPYWGILLNSPFPHSEYFGGCLYNDPCFLSDPILASRTTTTSSPSGSVVHAGGNIFNHHVFNKPRRSQSFRPRSQCDGPSVIIAKGGLSRFALASKRDYLSKISVMGGSDSMSIGVWKTSGI